MAFSLVTACSSHEAKRVEYSYETTKEAGARVPSDGRTRLVQIDVPAYYLVAPDGSQCEVDSARYAAIERGSREVCAWVQP